MPRSTGNYSRMSPGAIWLCQLLWLVLVVVVLAFDVMGGVARHAELVIPYADGGDAAIGQYLAAEHEALADLGITVSAMVWYFEGLAGAVTLAGLIFGGLIYWQRRDSLVAFVASLFLILVSVATTQNIDALARTNPIYEPFGALFQTLSAGSVLLLLFLFPSGRFITRGLRWALLAWALIHTIRLLFPHPSAEMAVWTPTSMGVINLPFFLLGLALQVRRYRSVSTPEERQQTKWIVVAFTVLVLVHAVIIVTVFALPAALGTMRLFDRTLLDLAYVVALFHLYLLAFTLTPVAFFFAILRYRLWDIDFIINRSLVYGSLTTALVLFFAGSVLGVRQLMFLFTDGEHLWVALCVAMLVVGLAFQPSRRFLHDLVNRRIYGIEIDYRPPLPTAPAGMGGARSLEGYRDLQLIGRGGMADVYRATDLAHERDVAIKVMHESLAHDDPVYILRFEREAEIVARLRHKNIVELYDHGVTPDGARFMVMEHVEGTDLRTYLQQETRLSIGRAQPLLEDLSRALDFAHEEGVIHRDLKPSNVLLDATGKRSDRTHRAVLGDFGIAKLLEAQSALTTTNLVGTIEYISPEQIRDSAVVDGRADVYSMGVLAYQLVTGVRPFEKNSPVALMLAHLHQPPVDPRSLCPELPSAAAGAILKALAKKPDDRFGSVGEMVAAMGAGEA